jgi:nucleoside-diphosphate-sugar epimerase
VITQARVVVTGGAGRIGRHLCADLERDREVVVADLRDGCDVTRLGDVRRVLEGAHGVCHLGGIDYDVPAPPEEIVRVNTLGTWNVLQAAAELGVRRVVLASSSAAYGLFDGSRAEYLPVDEDHPYAPRAPYSLSKAVTEEMGRYAARETGLTVVALQPLHVVFPEHLGAYLRFRAEAPPDWPHNWVAVQDVARAFRAALDAEISGFEAVLIGARDAPVAKPTLDWYPGPRPPLRDAAWFEDEPRASPFSCAKAAALLDWRPHVSAAEMELV